MLVYVFSGVVDGKYPVVLGSPSSLLRGYRVEIYTNQPNSVLSLLVASIPLFDQREPYLPVSAVTLKRK